MCLIINKNNPEPITTEQDIVCYKVLKKKQDNKIFKAPIYNFEYCFGDIYTIQNEYFKKPFIYDDGECLAEYGFHSFVSLSDAVRFKCRLLLVTRQSFEFVIAKCTIPNGTRYYKGKQKFYRNESDSPDGYCSEAIRIDEIVNENEIQ